MEAENIPVYLQNPVLWSICALFQAIGDSADEQAEAGKADYVTTSDSLSVKSRWVPDRGSQLDSKIPP